MISMDRRSAGTWSSEVIASTGQASMHELSLVPIHGSLITYTTPTTHAVAAVRPVDRSQGSRGHRGVRRPASGCIAVACEYTSSASRPPGSSNADARPRCAPGRATLVDQRACAARRAATSRLRRAGRAGWLASAIPTQADRLREVETAGRRLGRQLAVSDPDLPLDQRVARSSPRWVSAPPPSTEGHTVCFSWGTAPTALPSSERARRLHPTPRPHARSARHARTTGRSSRIRSPRS